MKRRSALALLVGLVLATGLVVYYGAGDIGRLLLVAGWGIVAVSAAHVVPLVLETLAWRAILRRQGVHQPFGRLVLFRWVGYAVNALFPVAQVGGEVVRARLIMRAGVAGPTAAASLVLDLTATLLSLVIFVLMGLLVLAAGGGAAVPLQVLGAVALLGLLLLAFYRAQRSGLLLRLVKRLEGSLGRRRWSAAEGVAALDDQLDALYAEPDVLARATAWRVLAWVAGAAEIWLALWFLEQPAGFLDALVLESVGQAARNVGFLVPAGLGFQEGGFVLAGRLVGIAAEVALALALVKRARDLLLGVPALIWWQISEGRRLLH